MPIINPHDPLSWPLGYNRKTPTPFTTTENKLSTEQLKALRSIYDRGPLDMTAHTPSSEYQPLMPWGTFRDSAELNLEQTVLMVYWCGMWLGIEKDGYTHS